MKSLLTISTLIFTVMFSSASYAEWKLVSESVRGHTFYVDFERIRKHDGYVYWWYLTDLLEPDKDGDLSYISYVQGDCGVFRHKTLSEWYYKQDMGRGTRTTSTLQNPQWNYPAPDSNWEVILKEVCDR